MRRRSTLSSPKIMSMSANTAEKYAQKEYVELMTDSKESRAQDLKSLTETESSKADVEGSLTEAKENQMLTLEPCPGSEEPHRDRVIKGRCRGLPHRGQGEPDVDFGAVPRIWRASQRQSHQRQMSRAPSPR